MFGKAPIEPKQSIRSVKKDVRQPVLEFVNAETHAEGLAVSLKEINLQVFPGEIVGVAGVSGNGQRELGELALGLETCTSGKKMLMGDNATDWSIGQFRQRGVAFIPENALMLAVAPNMSLMENMTLSYPWRYSQYGGLSMNWRKVQNDLEKSFKQFNLIAPSIYSPARILSGGNLQRLVIARELAHTPKLIIASYLTRGLDVRSTIAAHQALLNARASGAGILLISEDLEELFTLSDRLIVLYGGRIVGSFRPVETNYNEIGHLMTGSKVEHVSRN
jgi:ABC-type uncharacterized transport system ATPase subunit